MTGGQQGGRPIKDGWYANPHEPGGERYWNGAAWTTWSGDQGQVYPAQAPSALTMWGIVSCLLFPPAGILIGAILVRRGQRRTGWKIVALNTVALIATVAVLA